MWTFSNYCSYLEQSLIWDCDTKIQINQFKKEKKNCYCHYCRYYCHHQAHWRTSDSLSLDDPRLPKLWLEHSLLANPCGKKKQESVFFMFQQPKTQHQWQRPDIDQYELTLVPPLVLPVLPPVLPLTPPIKRASSSSCLRGSRLCSSSMVPTRD